MSVERVLSGKIARLIGCLVCGVFLCLIAGCGEDSGEGDDGSRAKSVGKVELIEKGRELFERNGCLLCHGEEGRGDGRIARTLKPPPRNFGDLAAYKQGAGVEEMMKTIKSGIAGGSTMPAYPHLSAEDRKLIATFIQYLQEQP